MTACALLLGAEAFIDIRAPEIVSDEAVFESQPEPCPHRLLYLFSLEAAHGSSGRDPKFVMLRLTVPHMHHDAEMIGAQNMRQLALLHQVL
jgi:hypothetical protein